MRITIDIPELDTSSEKEVRYILMDSLYEFVSHRGPTTEEYVNRRYPNTPEYAWLNRAEKIKQVNRRIILAQQIHAGNITVS